MCVHYLLRKVTNYLNTKYYNFREFLQNRATADSINKKYCDQYHWEKYTKKG